MSLRNTFTRAAIALTAGTLVAVAGAAPALADGGRGPGRGINSGGLSRGWGNDQDNGRRDDDRGDNGRRLSEGRITSRDGLALRTAPNRGSRIIRIARRGEIIGIYCRTSGDRVDGNPLWYLLTDGTWAWGPARFIDNLGPTPRWC